MVDEYDSRVPIKSDLAVARVYNESKNPSADKMQLARSYSYTPEMIYTRRFASLPLDYPGFASLDWREPKSGFVAETQSDHKREVASTASC